MNGSDSTTCPYCGGTMPVRTHTGQPRRQCGKPECKRLHTNAEQRRFQAEYRELHGISYARARYPEQRREYTRQWRDDDPERARQSRRAGKHRRRAAESDATAEHFLAGEIYERDGWLCWLCNAKVPRDAQYPDPQSPSIDHVVPISKGGAHTRANVRLAHVGCNRRRGARPVSEGGREPPPTPLP